MPHPPFETFLTSCSLTGLCQKGCHILVKNWIFDDPFHKKWPVLVILVPVMIRPLGSEFFWGNWHLEAVEAAEVAEAAEINEAGEVSKGLKNHYWGLQKSSRFLNPIFWGLYFDVLKKKSFDRILKLILNLIIFTVGGRWGCVGSKKIHMIDQA